MSIVVFPPLPAGFERFSRLAGVDEVGRGPLAGPVVAAAVILPPGFLPEGLNDSKKLSAAKRDTLADLILRNAQVGLAYIPAPWIDRINIRQASLLAMTRAVHALPVEPDAILIDGRDVPKGLSYEADLASDSVFDLAQKRFPAKAIIKGDATVAAIAAASIVAKVARDRMMAEAARHYPGYGFEKHAGYPTQAHRDALTIIGLSPLHRRSFGPCKGL